MIDAITEIKHTKTGRILVGIDEVGRGCLAGPVYAAAVVLNYDLVLALPDIDRNLIRDSKTLSAKQRQRALAILSHCTIDHSIGIATVAEIDSLGILGATFVGMKRALGQLKVKCNLALIDGNQKIPDLEIAQECVVGGDSKCLCIAAASIYAKEARDQFMRDQGKIFPLYGFEKHVGYGTKFHMDAMQANGITPLHRKSFAPVAKLAHTYS